MATGGEIDATPSWRGAGLVFVAAPELEAARRVVRALEMSRQVATRVDPGIATLACATFGQVRGLYDGARDTGGVPGSTTDAERLRLGIEAREEAAEAARSLVHQLVAHTRSIHDRPLLAEPLIKPETQHAALAAVLPDARYVMIVDDPRRQAAGAADPGRDVSITVLVDRWRSYVEAAWALRDRLGPEQVLIVGPEDLASPAGSAAVCSFVGIDASPAVLDALAPPPSVPLDDDRLAVVDRSTADLLAKLGWGTVNGTPTVDEPPAFSAPVLQQPEDEVVWKAHERRSLGYVAVWRHVIHTLTDRRELVWQLFKRDFVSTFRKSFLGLGWLFVGPLLGIIQWLVIQQHGLLATSGTAGVPYPLYVLLGTTMWGLFLGLYTATKASLTSAGPLLLQLRFPAEALVIQKTGQQLATFAAAMIVTVGALVVYGIAPAWQAVFLPLVVLPLTLFATATGLLVAMIAVVAIDVDRILTIFWGLALWLTPVVYTQKDVTGILATIVEWNPLTYLLTAPRSLVLEGTLGDPWGFVAATAFSLFAFLIATRLFHVSQPQLVERLV